MPQRRVTSKALKLRNRIPQERPMRRRRILHRERNDPGPPDSAVTRQQRDVFNDAGGRNEFVRRAGGKIELGTLTGDLQGEGKHSEMAQPRPKLRTVEVNLQA